MQIVFLNESYLNRHDIRAVSWLLIVIVYGLLLLLLLLLLLINLLLLSLLLWHEENRPHDGRRNSVVRRRRSCGPVPVLESRMRRHIVYFTPWRRHDIVLQHLHRHVFAGQNVLYSLYGQHDFLLMTKS